MVVERVSMYHGLITCIDDGCIILDIWKYLNYLM